MGIWTDAFIAPAEPVLLPVERFGRMLVELGRERIVRMPWTLLAGDLCVNAELAYISIIGDARLPPIGTERVSEVLPPWVERDDDPPPWGTAHEEARILARSDAVLDVPPALRAAPYGTVDIAVAFHGLDFTNPRILDHYWFEDHRTVLACYALARQQTRPVDANSTGSPGGPVHPVRTLVATAFKHGERGPCSVIEAVVSRHLGPDLVSGQTWG
jgi:hypothetical protein